MNEMPCSCVGSSFWPRACFLAAFHTALLINTHQPGFSSERVVPEDVAHGATDGSPPASAAASGSRSACPERIGHSRCHWSAERVSQYHLLSVLPDFLAHEIQLAQHIWAYWFPISAERRIKSSAFGVFRCDLAAQILLAEPVPGVVAAVLSRLQPAQTGSRVAYLGVIRRYSLPSVL